MRYFLRKLQAYFKEITVQIKLKSSTLKLSQALGNGQSKSAALCISGNIAADKTFGQFFGRDIQRLCRNIFQSKDNLIMFQKYFGLDSCIFHGIFQDIAEKIFKNTPHTSAVGRDHGRSIREMRH